MSPVKTHTVDAYVQHLYLRPWADFQIDRMHENYILVSRGYLRDSLFRQTGRTTRRLLEYIAANVQNGRIYISDRQECFRFIQRTCRDLLDGLGLNSVAVLRHSTGFVDHLTDPSHIDALYAYDGIIHHWSEGRTSKTTTCITCLSIDKPAVLATK